MDGDASAGDVVRSRAFLDRFLAGRAGRTRTAYQIDIEDFARYVEESPASAVAKLLGAGRVGERMALDYAVELLGAGRARSTVARRLGTLRTLAREAYRIGLVAWQLDIPTEDAAAAASRERGTSASYLLPRHPAEIDRLDVQHYALREALGANHRAPIDAPRRVLDAGCGTGQWGFDLCAEFPDARVVGLDLVPGKAGGPDRYAFVKGNLLQGLPFRDAQFDFVHQRFLVAGVPLTAWPSVVADLVRTLTPGGWIELVEARLMLEPAGPVTRRLVALAMEMASSLGLDTSRAVADSIGGFLRGAGLERVDRHEFALPVGQWGGRVGELMETDARAGLTRVCEVLHSLSRLSLEEGIDMIQQLPAEFERHQTTFTCAIATGRKPPLRHV
jgi:SAM-dependent methyltransferase